MEVLENIDLNKLLDELKMRDKKLKQLKGLGENISEQVEAAY
jgi:hypothetical protein